MTPTTTIRAQLDQADGNTRDLTLGVDPDGALWLDLDTNPTGADADNPHVLHLRTDQVVAIGLLHLAREAWPDRTSMWDMPTNLAVVLGDLSRGLRDGSALIDGGKATLARELGNLLLMAARYCDDLGISLTDAIAAATEAQQAYRGKRDAS